LDVEGIVINAYSRTSLKENLCIENRGLYYMNSILEQMKIPDEPDFEGKKKKQLKGMPKWMLNPEIEDYLTPEQKRKYREALKIYKKRKKTKESKRYA